MSAMKDTLFDLYEIYEEPENMYTISDVVINDLSQHGLISKYRPADQPVTPKGMSVLREYGFIDDEPDPGPTPSRSLRPASPRLRLMWDALIATSVATAVIAAFLLGMLTG